MIKKNLSPLDQYTLPYLELEAKEPGPTVWLTACLHGDEVGSIAIVHEVFNLAARHLKRGCIKAFPAVNRPGFKAKIRSLGRNGEDLNRCFGQPRKRTLAHRLANYIETSIENDEPALVIDIHNDWVNTVPYILIDSPALAGEAAIQRVRGLTASSGLVRVCDFTEEINVARHTLSGSLMARGISAITLEAGESFRVHETMVQTALHSISAMLNTLELISDTGLAMATDLNRYPAAARRSILPYSQNPQCQQPGLLRMQKRPGDTLKAGEVIARIFDHLGNEVDQLLCPARAILIGYADYAAVETGSRPIALALL